MKIAIVTPAGKGSRSGNRNTARRWASLLGDLGHRTTVDVTWDGSPADLLIALHARKSHDSVRRYRDAWPGRPVVLALTGTDLYRDIRFDPAAQESMRMADRMIVLQDMGLRELSPALRCKTRVIYQSAMPIAPQPRAKRWFEVCVIGHLREEKDPFRAAMALPHLPPGSRVRVVQVGRAMDPGMEREALLRMEREHRYRWLGEVPPGEARRRLARCHLMVISSRMEGGANVVTEAIVAGTPVIASRIPGNLGMLGGDYAGYFPPEDERALARLLARAETDAGFLRTLARQVKARRPLVTERREREALRCLLAEVGATGAPRRR